jgi:hypothetical protein
MLFQYSGSSAASLSSLGEARAKALNAIGIGSLRDFLVLPAVMDARAMIAASAGRVTLPAGSLLRDKFRSTPADKAPALPLKAMATFDEKQAPFLAGIGVNTISDLAAMSREIEGIVFQSLTASNGFSERPSAPDELIPKIIGSVATNVAYASFVQEKSVEHVALSVDSTMIDALPVTFALTDGEARNSVEALIGQLDKEIAARGLQKVLKDLVDNGGSARSLANFLRKKARLSTARERRNIGALFEDLRNPQIGLG